MHAQLSPYEYFAKVRFSNLSKERPEGSLNLASYQEGQSHVQDGHGDSGR